MLLIVKIVSRLNRAVIANFPGSLLRRRSKSASVHPNRFNSSATIRSAFAAALSRRNSPLW